MPFPPPTSGRPTGSSCPPRRRANRTIATRCRCLGRRVAARVSESPCRPWPAGASRTRGKRAAAGTSRLSANREASNTRRQSKSECSKHRIPAGTADLPSTVAIHWPPGAAGRQDESPPGRPDESIAVTTGRGGQRERRSSRASNRHQSPKSPRRGRSSANRPTDRRSPQTSQLPAVDGPSNPGANRRVPIHRSSAYNNRLDCRMMHLHAIISKSSVYCSQAGTRSIAAR